MPALNSVSRTGPTRGPFFFACKARPNPRLEGAAFAGNIPRAEKRAHGAAAGHHKPKETVT